jgi:hypothetical protein
MMAHVQAYFASPSPPDAAQVTNAFWCACHGGQREAAEYLQGKGADFRWVGHDGLTPVEAAARSHADDLVRWLLAIAGA